MPHSGSNQLWQSVLPKRFRELLQDIDLQIPVYEEEKIIDLLITAAKLVSGDLGLNSKYTINTQSTVILPDPLDSPEDEAFTNLILLRGQLMLATGEWRKSVRGSVEINFGPRIGVNFGENARAYADYVKELRQQYKDELLSYKLNHLGKTLAVMSGSPVGPDYVGSKERHPYSDNIVF